MSFSTEDTIVAIATPPGRGGIGVVRISGPGACAIARALTGEDHFEPRRATFVRVRTASASDQAIVTWFQAPRSYTGEEVIEISAHGSPVLLQSIVQQAIASGARLAEPGEFTLRAYLSGALDLVQAEAVRDLVDAVTPLQARAAFDQLEGTLTGRISGLDAMLFDVAARLEASLDFAGEGYHFIEPGRVADEIGRVVTELDALLATAGAGRLIREGAQVVIVGRPNAGKSTLFNALAGAERAIVTDVPGTTRDLLTELVDIEGVAVTLVDTAGVRPTSSDAVEAEGISRARQAVGRADLLLVVLDRSRPLTDEDLAILAETARTPRLVVAAKCDLPPAGSHPDMASVEVSAATTEGLAALRASIVDALGANESLRDTPALTNVRHIRLLETAREALARARDAAAAGIPEEFVSADVFEARSALEEITGRRSVDDTLHAIFERFCIGK